MKRMIRVTTNFIFAGVFMFTMTFCKKEKNYQTSITGQVRDYYSQKGIPLAKIAIANVQIDPQDPHLRYWSPTDSSNLIHSINADLNGNYTISFDDIKNDYCKVFVINDSIISNEIFDVKIGQMNTLDIIVKHTKQLHLHVKNINNIYDKITVYILVDNDGYTGGTGLALSNTYTIKGFNKDTLILNRTIPDVSCRVNYTMSKQNKSDVWEHFDLTIDHAMDSITYDLNY